MRILIIGNGWLAKRMKEDVWPNALIVDNYTDAQRSITSYDVLINCAAKTNIDFCEKDKISAFMSNVQLAGDLADLCYKTGKRYVFISSACIFESKDSNDIKYEDSWPNPGCFYALTKWMGEELVQALNPFSLIVRLRLPLSEVPSPRNTITKILSYPYLNNNQESVTIIEDFLPVLKALVEDQTQKGVFHLVNEGTISPEDIGNAFGHKFSVTTKEEQDTRMKWENRARRVTTYVGSKKIPLLPNLTERFPKLVEKYKAAL